jgi:hypothetical protein
MGPTSRFSTLGTLSAGVAGQPVVLAASGQVARAPMPSPARDRIHIRTKPPIHPDGWVLGRSLVHHQGRHEVASRYWHHSRATRHMDDIVPTVLGGHQETGTGHITHPASANLQAPWQVDAEFALEPVVNLPVFATMTLPVGGAPGSICMMHTLKADLASQRGRPAPRPTTSRRSRPNSHSPRACCASRPTPASSAARWRLQGRTMLVRRELMSQYASTLCGAEERRARETVLLVMRRDQRRKVFPR